MGRYAFFNTEFEYKFAFGVQDSNDIQLFGGIGHEGVHTWSEEDKPYIYELLKDLHIDFEKYINNIDGTYELEKDLHIDSTRKLGCLIYHQLLYTEELTCEYEY